MRMPSFLTALVAFLLSAALAGAEDWPQWRGPHRDGVWNEEGVLEGAFPEDGLEELWRVDLGAGYSGPTVAQDRVFVTDRVTKPTQQERVLCFDAKSGAELWRHVYDSVYTISYTAGPRAAVTVADDRAYALGAMGHLHCLDAGTGAVLWSHDLNAEYQIADRMPIWGISGAPLVFENLLIVQVGGANGSCIVAFDKRDGEEVWRALDDRAGYSSPILIEQADQPVVLCWTGDSVAGIAAKDGKVLWRFPFAPSRMPIGIATPLVKDNQVFVTSFYDGSLMLRLDPDEPKVEPVWRKVGPDERNTEALHSIISTPIWLGDHIYGVDSYGELRCLEAATGERVWEDQTAVPKARWSTIHFVQHGPRVWMFNERGELLLGELKPSGFREIDRAKIIEPTLDQLRDRGGVCWSHPAFANRCIFVRNDEALVCVNLAADQ